MNEYRSLMLWTDFNIYCFSCVHKEKIEVMKPKYIKWVRSLKLMQWAPITRPDANFSDIAFAVGILCVIHEEGEVKFTFNENATHIRRDPADEKEYQQWLNIKQ